MVLGLVEAWNSKDVDALLALLDPSIQWHDRVLFPDAGVHIGRAAVESHLREIAATLDLRWDVDEVIAAGDSVVLCATLRGQGRESGAPFEERVYAIGTVRGGRVVRRESYSTRAAALRAAGVADDATE